MVDDGNYNAVLVSAALLCLARAWRVPQERTAWALIGVGLAAWSAADIHYTYVLADLESPPYPTISDAGWLLFNPACWTAVVLLMRRRIREFHASLWLDGIVAALGMTIVDSADTDPTDALQRHPDLGDHVDGVAALAERTALELGMADDQRTAVRQAAILHDIGKAAVPDAILSKPGPLDEDEWAFMRRHTVIGERIMQAAPALGELRSCAGTQFDQAVVRAFVAVVEVRAVLSAA